MFFIMPHSHYNGFYEGHQYSWTLTPANSMQVSIMQPDNCNRKYPGQSNQRFMFSDEIWITI